MPWIEKSQRSRLDDFVIHGLFYLDGDMMAYYLTRLAGAEGVPVINPDWIKGQKAAQIEFPSGEVFTIRESSVESTGGLVEIMGEIELPYFNTRNEAWVLATHIAMEIGYGVERRGDSQLEIIGIDEDDHYLVTYNNEERRMMDIQKLEPVPYDQPRQPLLDEKSKAALPPLYANEQLGMQALAQVKFFSPDGNWTWYATEYDGENIFFGLVVGFEIELGYFNRQELEELRGPLGLKVERDRYFEPTTLEEIRTKHQRERYE